MTRKRTRKGTKRGPSRERKLYPFTPDTTLFSVLALKGYKPYYRLLDDLSGVLLNAPQSRQEAQRMRRLMFRQMCRGEKKQVYMALGAFCRSHPFANRRWSTMVFARWLASPDHTNLNTSAWTIARLIRMY